MRDRDWRQSLFLFARELLGAEGKYDWNFRGFHDILSLYKNFNRSRSE
jgi:hypothetical protein